MLRRITLSIMFYLLLAASIPIIIMNYNNHNTFVAILVFILSIRMIRMFTNWKDK